MRDSSQVKGGMAQVAHVRFPIGRQQRLWL